MVRLANELQVIYGAHSSSIRGYLRQFVACAASASRRDGRALPRERRSNKPCKARQRTSRGCGALICFTTTSPCALELTLMRASRGPGRTQERSDSSGIRRDIPLVLACPNAYRHQRRLAQPLSTQISRSAGAYKHPMQRVASVWRLLRIFHSTVQPSALCPVDPRILGSPLQTSAVMYLMHVLGV